jgi:hypothetical protein
MRPALLVPASVLLIFPAAAFAQTPIPTQPKITIETINLQSVKIDRSTSTTRLQYTRAGNKPTEFRAANNSAFTGASWSAFTEGTTTTKLVNNVTWTTGFIKPASLNAVGDCGANTVKMKAFLQFRGVNKSLQTISSNIVSDSLCVPFG